MAIAYYLACCGISCSLSRFEDRHTYDSAMHIEANKCGFRGNQSISDRAITASCLCTVVAALCLM